MFCKNIFTTPASRIPIKANNNIVPTFVKSLFVLYPYNASAAKMIEVIKKILIIEETS